MSCCQTYLRHVIIVIVCGNFMLVRRIFSQDFLAHLIAVAVPVVKGIHQVSLQGFLLLEVLGQDIRQVQQGQGVSTARTLGAYSQFVQVGDQLFFSSGRP